MFIDHALREQNSPLAHKYHGQGSPWHSSETVRSMHARFIDENMNRLRDMDAPEYSSHGVSSAWDPELLDEVGRRVQEEKVRSTF